MAITAALVSRSATREVWDIISSLDNDIPGFINIAHQLGAIPSEVSFTSIDGQSPSPGLVSGWVTDRAINSATLVNATKSNDGAAGSGLAVPQVRLVFSIPHSIVA